MKEYKLTVKDFSIIKNAAHVIWIHDAIKHDHFVVECYIRAFIGFVNSNNLKIIDGKLYEAENLKSN
jgi:hypothetical protein